MFKYARLEFNMKRVIFLILFMSVTMLGCAQNHFNISAENYAEKVNILGVAPIFMDADSDIMHPQKELLTSLISDLNRKYEPLLVRNIKNTGNYYAVSLQSDEPKQLFSSLLARREKRDDADVQYNKYFWKNDEIAAYLKKNRLDAVMLIVVSGLTRTSKLYSSNLLTSLETNYNFLTMTAQILGADGAVLWEYPNFRGRILPYYPLTNLQYPDFSESEANITNKTEVRFKSIDGIRRTLEKKKSDVIFMETEEPEVYTRLFDEITSLVKHSVDKKTRGGVALDKPAPAATSPTVVIAPTPAPDLTPAPQMPEPKSNTEIPVAPTTTPTEVVPAT
jgi:hypothetical protein